MTRRKIGGSAVFLFAALAACAPADKWKTIAWQEEVKLSTGQVVVAKQFEQFRAKESAQRLGLAARYSIEATLPSPVSATVRWEGTIKPLAMDMAEGKLYLVAIATTRQGQRDYSIRDEVAPHAAFIYAGRADWQRIAIEAVPANIHPNLLISVGDLLIKQGYPPDKIVDLSTKTEVDSDPRINKMFRTWSAR